MIPEPSTPATPASPAGPSPAGVRFTRRRLVQAGGAATAALYLGPLTGAAAAGGVPPHLCRSAYAALGDPGFLVLTPQGTPVTLRLTEVADLVRARSEPAFAGRDDAFALSFSGPRGAVLGAGVHALRHPELGSFPLFIAPVGNGTAEQRYEAVVDRSVRLAGAEPAPGPMAHTNAAAAAPAGSAAPARAEAKARATAKAKAARLLQGVTVARRAGRVTADVRVAAHLGVLSVRVTLLRDGVEHARAARMLRGRAGVRLALRELRPTPAGPYELRVTVTGRGGRRTVSTRRVSVR